MRKPTEIVAAHMLSGGILAPDGAKRGRGGEERTDPVLGDHPPEGARIRRADRLALVEHRRVAVEQRRVDDVGVAHRPAEIGGGPVDLAGLDAVDVAHAPGEGDQVAAVVADDALGQARGARGVQDVERVGRGDRHAFGRRRSRHELGPVVISSRHAAAPALAGAGARRSNPAWPRRARWPGRAAACRG